MEAAPYDNVEFPVRKPGTGTWPGPGQNAAASSSSVKTVHVQQSTAKDGRVGPKLAPLMESMEVAESEDQRMQAKMFHSSQLGSHSTVSSSNTTSKPPASQLHTSSTTQSGGQSHTVHVQNQPQSIGNVTTYVPQKVNQPLKSKKDSEPPEQEDEDFRRSDFNPASQTVLDKAYTDHKHFYRLNTTILDEGSNLKQEVIDLYRKAGETLSYEQLIQGMLVEGEKLLLGGCWLYFTNVEFYDMECSKMLKEPIGRGRICLTNKRVLLLSAEIFTDSSLNDFGDTSKPTGGYKLQVTKSNNIFYQNLPLNTFHSAEMSASVGTTTQSKISILNPICWGACSCFGVGRCSRSWKTTPPMTKTFNRRVVKMGVAMPPWGTKMFVNVYLDPEMSLTTARDFVAQLQYHAPHLQ
ncbi:uncharacterized protein LOC124275758 [Haliotis rubra]|uniref:uncharacterized protein LOC124275758 n=1 Tax=Haliotis rubra TaxID=36100 RepID=UPI001EE618B1|nr:uncharacterized protein LOC124275758 [Haliotis rubra]XP_046567373.1 uncharacterized protein LOC124275758 [Haliotis rubra]